MTHEAGGHVIVVFEAMRKESRVRVFSPELSKSRKSADLENHEALELLSKLGDNEQDAQVFLQHLFQQTTARRRRFHLSATKILAVQSFLQPAC